MKEFWIVTKDSCSLQAPRRHESLEDAKNEAARLAGNEGKGFFVFKLVGAVKPAQPPVAWEGAVNG